MALRLLAFLALAATATAQPFVAYRGIVNSASFAPDGLPNGSIARGSIFTMFGRQLGPAQGATVSSFPLRTALAGTSVEVCQDGQCTPAIPVFTNSGQVNAIMPSNAPLGPVSLRVTRDGEAGNFAAANVVESSVGLFAVNSGGFGPGIVQNFVAQTNQPLNSTAISAGRRQVVTLWGTGLGAGLNADNVAPQAGDLPVEVEIFVGETRVTRRLYSGRSPCCSGVDQFVFEIPADAPTGCYAPVRVRAGGVVSNTVTIAVGEPGAACQDADNPFKQLVDSGNFGVIFLQRSNRLVTDSFGDQFPVDSDALIASFRTQAPLPFFFDPVLSPSPPGSCHVYTQRGDPFDRDPLPGTTPASPLDAGPELRVTTAAGPRTASPRAGQTLYAGLLGGNVDSDRREATPLVLDGAGPFMVAGAGGADVGAFQAQVEPPAAVQWTNREATETVDRAQGVTLEISGAETSNRMLSVWGGGYDRPTNSSATFACYVEPTASSFTVPASVLANVPAARERPPQSKGWLGLAYASHDSHADFTAAGITRGLIIFNAMTARTVSYR